jgi:hypothetical protein
MTKDSTRASLPQLSPAMQVALIEAHNEGQELALVQNYLRQYPALRDEIAEFMLALAVFDGPDPVPDPELEGIVARGLARGKAMAQAVAATPALTLREAMAARGVKKTQLARALRLGMDVLDRLVQGGIDLATVPARLFTQVGDALQASADEVRAWAEHSVPVQPQFRRGQAQTPSAAKANRQSFADAVHQSPAANMSEADRALWLQPPAEA